jgi:hypothetical protein
MTQRLPILTWHSIRVIDNDYAGNDPLAFASDLRLLDRLGWTIQPIGEALEALARGRLEPKTVALSVDGGSILDFEDVEHPSCGPQKSMARILREFAEEVGPKNRHQLHLSAFVIASPEARAELDQADNPGRSLRPDHWWKAANETGLLSIESRSWDHNHAALKQTVQHENRRGDFRWIASEEECRLEVDQASDYIERVSNRRPQFFAYPDGQASDYIRSEYLPRFGPDIGLKAAFSCQAEPVTTAADPWYLPRFVCGRDWASPEALESLLKSIE